MLFHSGSPATSSGTAVESEAFVSDLERKAGCFGACMFGFETGPIVRDFREGGLCRLLEEFEASEPAQQLRGDLGLQVVGGHALTGAAEGALVVATSPDGTLPGDHGRRKIGLPG